MAGSSGSGVGKVDLSNDNEFVTCIHEQGGLCVVLVVLTSAVPGEGEGFTASCGGEGERLVSEGVGGRYGGVGGVYWIDSHG